MSTAIRLTLVGAVATALSVLPLLELTDTGAWLIQASLALALISATGHLARRLRLPVLLTVIIQLAVLTWWIGLMIAADLAWLGFLPSTEWPARFVAVFGDGAELIATTVTPIAIPNAVLVYLVGGAGLVAIVVDLTVGSLRRGVLAGLPLGSCYAVTAYVEGGGLGWWWFVLPAAAYLAVLMAENRIRVAAWGRSTSQHRHPRNPLQATDALARSGRRVGAVAIAAAVAVPATAPVLSDGFLSGHGSGGSGGDGRTIRTDNPILDLQRNLTRPDNVDVLRYEASDEAPHYIRTVTLDSFDGEVWQTSDRPVPEEQRVDEGLPEPPGMDIDDPDEIELHFEITDNYSSRWLPLVYPAQQIEIAGDWRYDVATLDVVSTDDDVLGTEYTTVSLDVPLDAEILQDAGSPDSDVEELTELPDELPESVIEHAEEVTSDAEGDFAKAVALQEWFRGSAFTYDLDTQAGTSTSAVVDFLEDRRGYCEQFAGTMAIMARYLGIPARVAVGFTPGTFEGDATWLVRAHDAHAWPELYFEGVGWVPWEPTPAARTGTAPEWTTEPREAPSTDGETPEGSDATTAPDDQETLPEEEMFGGGGSATPGETTRWPWAIVAIAGIGIVLVAVPSRLAALRRWLRWRRAGTDPVACASAAWSDLSEATRDAGFAWNTAATPRTVGRTLAASAGLTGTDRDLLDHLVGVVERARYARTHEQVTFLRGDTAVLCATLRHSAGRGRRLRAFLWPTALRDAVRAGAQRISAMLDRWESARSRRLKDAPLRR
ncbi:transglutaminase domain-containing protein [Actinobacteria bacterium YIM 96077]|uniref:Transglutaminase-like domain-containing protein n=1 Tax=Phytoactinopolyspora halophila TaxID=1981511 RepID=A0A329QYH5_9ACTN|nr:DUF3488 and transglutaminase-like domain-containing protein [Phytoactinopolyspora halophila]AYY12835.1 transglutaminase domain-containing protein [Actinobacteria bacterium YIM 96077]RAW16372.1 hypothetical protein DPM12_06985 [Phytoactinopolyspora halophila]